jgi:hypothetical protein
MVKKLLCEEGQQLIQLSKVIKKVLIKKIITSRRRDMRRDKAKAVRENSQKILKY